MAELKAYAQTKGLCIVENAMIVSNLIMVTNADGVPVYSNWFYEGWEEAASIVLKKLKRMFR